MPSLLLLLALLFLTPPVRAESGRVIKVLPHFLDRYGRHALSPSLYDRDAYQAELRRNPERRSSMRFNVQWRARGLRDADLNLRLEVRGTKTEDEFRPAVFETRVRPRRLLSRWTPIVIAAEDFTRLGEVVAWRVSLWHGDTLLSEQRSFLW